MWVRCRRGCSSRSRSPARRRPLPLPQIFGGLKESITLAHIGAVIGEFVSYYGQSYLTMLVAQRSLERPIHLDDMNMPGAGSEMLRQHTEPATHLQHDVGVGAGGWIGHPCTQPVGGVACFRPRGLSIRHDDPCFTTREARRVQERDRGA